MKIQKHQQRESRGSDRLLKPCEAAELLGTTPATLASWRCTRAVQIPFVKIGRNARYRLSDLERFIQNNTKENDNE